MFCFRTSRYNAFELEAAETFYVVFAFKLGQGSHH